MASKEKPKSRITVESYIPYPNLRANAIPFAADKDKRPVGLIAKVIKLDPYIAKNYIYLDKQIVDAKHTVRTETGIERLINPKVLDELSKSSAEEHRMCGVSDNQDPGRLFHAEKILNDPIIQSLLPSYFGKPLDPNDPKGMEKSKGFQMLVENNGVLIKPIISFDDLKEKKFCKTGEFEAEIVEPSEETVEVSKPSSMEIKVGRAKKGAKPLKCIPIEGLPFGPRRKPDGTPASSLVGEEIKKSDMYLFDSCRYENPYGLSLREKYSTINDFVRIFDMRRSDADADAKAKITIFNRKLFNLFKTIEANGVNNRDTYGKKFTYDAKIPEPSEEPSERDPSKPPICDKYITKSEEPREEDPKSMDISQGLVELFTPITDDAYLEQLRVDALKSLSGDTVFALDPDDFYDVAKVDKVSAFAKHVLDRYNSIAIKRRHDACSIITVLRDLQEHKGWHMRVSPINSFEESDGIKAMDKVQDFTTGKNDDAIHLKSAYNDFRHKIDLLRVCDPTDAGSSCLHPLEYQNLGVESAIIGVDPAKFNHNSALEPSTNARFMAFLDIDMDFVRNLPTPYARYLEIKRHLRKIDHASRKGSLTSFDDLATEFKYLRFDLLPLQRDMMIGEESKTVPYIPYIPNPPKFVSKGTLREIPMGTEIPEKIATLNPAAGGKDVEVYMALKKEHDDIIAANPPKFKPEELVIKTEGEPDTPYRIQPTDFYKLDAYTHYEYDGEIPVKSLRCMRARYQYERGEKAEKPQFRINLSSMLLTDGDGDIIPWRDERGRTGRQLSEVIEEIVAKKGIGAIDGSAADPKTWKWTCIADQERKSVSDLLDGTSKKPMFLLQRSKFRRAINVHKNRKVESKDIELSIPKNTILEGLRDAAITARNAVVLGNLTQVPDYTDAVSLAKRSDWLKTQYAKLGVVKVVPDMPTKSAGESDIAYQNRLRDFAKQIYSNDFLKDWTILEDTTLKEARETGGTLKLNGYVDIERAIAKTMTDFELVPEWNAVEKLTISKPNKAVISLHPNKLWNDPTHPVVLKRRKGVADQRFGIPKDLFVDPLVEFSNLSEDARKKIETGREVELKRLDARGSAVLALRTNLDKVYDQYKL